METALKSVSPLSKEERNLLAQRKHENYLRTATGIPSASEPMISTDRFRPLPPITTKVKPQVTLFVYCLSLCCPILKALEKIMKFRKAFRVPPFP